MPTKTKEKFTLKNTIVYDPILKRFIQKGHIVHGKKLLQYPEAICEYSPCSKKYPKKRKGQRFCSTSCRMKWWIRQHHNGKDPDYGKATCPIDGVIFKKTRPWSKYCCDGCQTEGRRRLTAQSREQKTVPKSV